MEIKDMVKMASLHNYKVSWIIFNMFNDAYGVNIVEDFETINMQLRLVIYSDKRVNIDSWNIVLKLLGLDKEISYKYDVKDFEQSWYNNTFEYLLVLK